MESDFARLVERLYAISRIGLTYCQAPYDLERYRELAEIASGLIESVGASPARLKDLFEQEVGYVTPKIDVRAMIYRGDEVLLVREKSDGRWTAPGGWADVGQSPAQAVEKEVREESGYTARATRLLALYDRDKQGHPPMAWHLYKVFFLCEITGGAPTVTLETDGVAFFKLSELPPLSLPRVTEAQIRRFHEHYLDPTKPALFD